MRKFMNKLKTLWNDESGQGATEYILLIVIVFAVIAFFGPKLKSTLTDKVNTVTGDITGFTGQ